MYEAVKASSINYDFQLNEYNESAVDNANYALLLSLPDDKTNFSSSLTYLLNSYTFGNRIDNVPSAISLVSSVSYYINRSENGVSLLRNTILTYLNFYLAMDQINLLSIIWGMKLDIKKD